MLTSIGGSGGFPYSYSTMSKCFHSIQEEDLLLPASYLTLGSVRAGGATARFLEHGSIERLKFDMRLVGERSLAHYVQSVLGDLIDASLPPGTLLSLQRLEEVIGVGWSSPPPAPFDYFSIFVESGIPQIRILGRYGNFLSL